MTRLLCIGDMQIGAGQQYGTLPGDRLQDQRDALERAVDLAIELRVDAMLNGGDTFEGPLVSPAQFAAYQEPMRRLKAAGIPCIAAVGNGRHDLARHDVNAPTIMADVSEVFSVPGVTRVGDTWVAVLPWCSTAWLLAQADGGDREEHNINGAEALMVVARALRASIPAGARCVLLTHFAISSAKLPTGTSLKGGEIVFPLVELESLGFDAVAASHIHLRQVLSSGLHLVGDREPGPIFYTSSLTPTDFSEADGEHGATLIDLEHLEPARIEFFPIASRPFVTISLDLSNADDDAWLTEACQGDYNGPSLDGAVVKVQYTSTVSQAARVNRAKLVQALLDAGASKVYKVEPNVIRPTRARMENVTDGLDELEALGEWMSAVGVDEDTGEKVIDLTASYLDRLDASGASVAGGVKPLRVRAHNYRTFESLDFEIPEGVVALVGENGAGKSSVVNGIDLGLFMGRGEASALLSSGEDDMELTLNFESGGEMYRVRRGLRRGKSQTVDLERFELNAWEPISLASADATNERIVELVGLSRKTFGSTAFLRQGDGASFTEAGAAGRKTVLVESCGIEQWEGLLALAKVDLAAAEREVAEASAVIARDEPVAAERPQVEARLAHNREAKVGADGALRVAERELEQAVAALAGDAGSAERLAAAISAANAARAERDRLSTMVDQARAAAQSVGSLRADRGEASALAERVPELEQRAAEMLTAKARADAAIAERTAAQQQAATLNADAARRETELVAMRAQAAALHQEAFKLKEEPTSDDRCGSCQQNLGEEARTARIADLLERSTTIIGDAADKQRELLGIRRQATEATEAAERVNVPEVVDPAPVEAELAKARQASLTAATLTERITEQENKASTLGGLELQWNTASEATRDRDLDVQAAQAASGDVQAKQSAVSAARAKVDQAKAYAETFVQTITRDEEAMKRIARADEVLADARQIKERHLDLLDVLRTCCKAYGRDGVPALIVENSAIPQIEARANWILGEHGFDTTYHVELRTQREMKNGAISETLEIVVHDGVDERPYETFSGGERTRLNLALRIGLAELLAHKKGAASSLLIIDEPDWLDEPGVVRLVDILRALNETFASIMLVTHHPAGAASCDREIRIVKDGDRSRIITDEGAAVEALVAA